MTPNEELMARFLALCADVDRARAKFMARKAAIEQRYLEEAGKPFAYLPAAIEANPKEEPK